MRRSPDQPVDEPVDQPADATADGSAWRVERVGYGHADAVRLVAEVQAEYVVRYGGPDDTPLDPAMFEPPEGAFFVGYVDGRPVATGAWRRHRDVDMLGTAVTAEVKRMYVAAGVHNHPTIISPTKHTLNVR